MNTPTEPVLLAENGRFVVAEVGPRVMLIDRGPTPSQITVLLLAMSTLIFGGFGVVTLFRASGGEFTVMSLATGVAILGIGVVSFVAMNRANRARQRAMATPLSTVAPLAIFDRASSVYIDHNGEMIAHLSQVHCTTAGLGSAKLIVTTPDGTRLLAAGNPALGGLRNLAEALDQKIASG